MAGQRFEVLGLGNAIVDAIAQAEDDFLAHEGLNKGGMALIDESRASSLYARMGAATIMSGGSAANTIVGLASFGVQAAFIGKVKDDEAGRAFAHDIRASGVHFDTPFAADGPSTARCLVLVTPDGERTMNTYLGACQNLGPADVDAELVRRSSILYLEGYLWDPPAAKEAFVKAAGIAHASGNRVALTLSDSFCVDRYRDEFLDLMRTRTVDIVFANQHELKALYQTADFDTALAAFRNDTVLGVVTRSELGSMVVTRDETHSVPASPIEKLVDTTGAGDLFAAGFLAGLARDCDLKDCARLGGLAAAEVIQHYGARPQVRLADLASESGLALSR
ncbi:MAG: adenosine kinase [Beijerinckiaceae bacterium]|jgi:sugar/nucleoside kinase (ribokinase family)|nr:adenosine kinase [Beijerinckiaceae bacterium]